jgi:hypothetical protein
MREIREFVDSWVENSVHAREEGEAPGGLDAARALANRMILAAREQGFKLKQLMEEVGDPLTYIRAELDKNDWKKKEP